MKLTVIQTLIIILAIAVGTQISRWLPFLALAEIFRFDLLPLPVKQPERAHKLFVNQHLRRVHIRPEGIFKLRAEEIAHLLLHKSFQLFLSTAAEKQCGTHTAEKQHCR